MGQSEMGLVRSLMREGRSDEEIQAMTGVALLRLVELRIEAAMAPGFYGRLLGPEVSFAPRPSDAPGRPARL